MHEFERIRSRVPAAVLALCVALAQAGIAGQRQPGGKSGYRVSPAEEGKRVEAKNGVVTSANALASEAGVEMLRVGGNAVDAAVAAAFAIGVVEPQMSGVGGGGAAVVWMKRAGKAEVLDFYAAQPVGSWEGHTDPPPAGRAGGPAGQGGPPRRETSEQAGAAGAREPGDLRAAGIPGNVAGLLALHEKYGVLTRARVMAPAIRLAEEGFPVGQVLAEFIRDSVEKLKPFPEAYALYVPGGEPLEPGVTLRNPELARSLRRIRDEGRRGFYEGPTAEALIATLNAGKHPATQADLAGYQPRWRRPLCTDYRGRAVLSAPPPENGLQVLHTLELLEPFDLKSLGLPTRSAAAFDVLVSAMRVGQADARGNGDPDWVPVPANGISSGAYAAARKALVGTGAAASSIEPGDPLPFDQAPPAGDCIRYDPYRTVSGSPATALWNPSPACTAADLLETQSGETTHLSVVDKDGNAVALTQTNSSVFGSGGFAAGFFLNDSGYRLTGADIEAASGRRWRIRSTTIAPTIVLRKGNVEMVVGAPGGGRIPTEIVQVMVYTLDYEMDPLDAVKMPRILPSPQSPRVQLEHGFAPQLLQELRRMGYEAAAPTPGYARLYLIVRRGSSWVGVADPRHDGQPRGY